MSSESGRESNVLKIAIVGGGLVGAFTSSLLSRLPDTQVTVYEKSPSPHEVGAWISVTNASFEILSKTIDPQKLNRIVFRGNPVRTSVGRHWRTGEVLYEQPEISHDPLLVEARTHRIALHNVLLDEVPIGTIKYDHAVSSVDISSSGGGRSIINFKDWKHEPAEADLIIAADGIYSKIRHQFFPETAKVAYRGTVAYRTVFPEDIVAHIDLHNEVSSWTKDGEVVFVSKLGLGQFGIVAIIKEPPAVAAKLHWNGDPGESGKQHLIEYFQDWDPKITEVLRAIPECKAFPLETAPWLTQMTIDDKVVFVGDAAHPTSGAYGAGASFGFADAWALYRSLQETSTKYWIKSLTTNHRDLAFALFLFNETRTDFLHRVEKQMAIDRQVVQTFIDSEDDTNWRWRVNMIHHGNDWMRSHNVEFEFQKKRDEHLLRLMQVIDDLRKL